MAKPYSVQSTVSNSTAGASTELDYYIVKKIDSSTQFRGEDNGILRPFALTYDAARPGVDFPFSMWQSYDLLAHTPQSAWKKRKSQKAGVAMRAGEGMGIGTAIMSIPPDFTPVINSKFIFADLTALFKKWRNKKTNNLRTTYGDNKGVFPAFLNTTTYNGNVCTILDEIQAHMLEPTIDQGNTWTLWTRAEVLGFLNERLSNFLKETEIIQTSATIAVTPNVPSYALPSDLISLKRVAFQAISGTISPLTSTSEFEQDTGNPGWQNQTGTPFGYIEDLDESLQISLVNTPNVTGTLLIDYVPEPSPITGACTPLPIPGVFCPAIKYGVMADMLSKEGEANDPERAKYCEERYKEGIEMAHLLMEE